jgi:hypothetical protein
MQPRHDDFRIAGSCPSTACGLASVTSTPPDVEPSTPPARRSTMSQSNTLFMGMDVHNETIAVA